MSNNKQYSDAQYSLNNIIYKSPHDDNKEPIKTNNIDNLEQFLENERKSNKAESWSKLDKTMKFGKFIDYVDIYSKKHNLTAPEKVVLTQFLKECVDRKKLNKNKDVIYDIEKGTIESIPGLVYTNKRYSLKNNDKKSSASKGLGPKKNTTLKMSKQIQENIEK